VRITALHHAHAPHLNLVGLDVAAFGGFVKRPQTALPLRAPDFKLGNTWAFLIDLLDANGAVAFRIHYVDSSASPPHGVIPKALLAQRDIDVHIACVAGFEQSDSYPDAILEHGRAHYVLGAHWEDFFQPRPAPLMPLRQVLTEESMERFVTIVEQTLPTVGRLEPINKSPEWCAPPRGCGPRGRGWSLPVPGETFQFATAGRF